MGYKYVKYILCLLVYIKTLLRKTHTKLQEYYIYILMVLVLVSVLITLQPLAAIYSENEFKINKKAIIKEYHNIISGTVTDYLEQVYYKEQKYKKADNKYESLELLINNGRMHLDLRDIKERLDNILKEYIMYEVTFNNILLVKSNYDHTQKFYNHRSKVLDDNLLEVKIYINEQSKDFEYLLYTKEKIRLFFLKALISFTIPSYIILILWIRQYQLSKKASQYLATIKNTNFLIMEMLKTKEKLLSDYYGFYQTYNRDSIISKITGKKSNAHKTYNVEIKNIINSIEIIISGYREVSGYDIQFMKTTYTDIIDLPFVQEIFNQLITSIIFNILTFIKSKKIGYYINIIINKETIIILFNTFPLDKEALLYNGERIFIETQNPFCFNLNEIFLILDEYKIDYEISYSTGENILRITLPDYSDEGKGQLLQFSSPK